MSIARLDDGPQAQLLVLDGIRLVNHPVLPPHQVGVGLARPNRTGSSYGGQVRDPIHAQQLYGVREDGLQVPHDLFYERKVVDVVEVAREVHHDDPQISVPAVQASVEDQQVPGLRGGQVAGTQLVRGGSQDVARVDQVRPQAQGSAFQRFLVSKPRPGFVVSSAASDWFSPNYHKKV